MLSIFFFIRYYTCFLIKWKFSNLSFASDVKKVYNGSAYSHIFRIAEIMLLTECRHVWAIHTIKKKVIFHGQELETFQNKDFSKLLNIGKCVGVSKEIELNFEFRFGKHLMCSNVLYLNIAWKSHSSDLIIIDYDQGMHCFKWVSEMSWCWLKYLLTNGL